MWKPISFGRNAVGISHLFFADDLVLFAEADLFQAQVISKIMETFCDHSGHKISYEKTQFYCSPNVPSDVVHSLSEFMEFRHTDDLGKYLGVPLIHGRVSKLTYQSIVDKTLGKTDAWNPHLFSLAGRLTLCK